MEDNVGRTMNDWIKIYKAERGITINGNTIRKRRMVSGLGTLVPPRTYLLTRAEFERVMKTPLPFCSAVINQPKD